MRRLLITGGPVHAHLDAVKIITNRFRGGLMARLATHFATHYPCEVTYLTAPGAYCVHPEASPSLQVVTHQGYHDYREQVLRLAPDHSDVILGAAVANLVPQTPWIGKFPSHDYQEGDVVNVPFLVAPRIITQVKQAAPRTHLFGFKLLSQVSLDHLVSAAYGIVLDAHADAVIANDTADLMTKHVVTRERGVHTFEQGVGLEDFLWSMMNDTHYRTATITADPPPGGERLLARARQQDLAEPGFFVRTPEGLMFGTVAQRAVGNSEGFWTTGRGKHELEQAVFVERVDPSIQTVHTVGPVKATLNAPLLAHLFRQHPTLHTIVHGHVQRPDLPTLPYAPPGTVRDTNRQVSGSFNVAGHGCFLLYDSHDRLMMS